MNSPRPIRTLGLVGGIASGKSTVAKWLSMRGWLVVDADQEVHRLYGAGQALVGPVVERFGNGILRPDGAVDRAALGRVVFGDPVALRDLEALVHPVVREAIAQRLGVIWSAGGKSVLEMALLYRWPEMVQCMELVVGVHVSNERRSLRLQARNGIGPEEALRRLSLQDQDQILAPAQLVIDNDGDLHELSRSLDEWLGPLVG